MSKFLRPGKVVIFLKGRFAGKKAVIVKNTYSSMNLYPSDVPFSISISVDEQSFLNIMAL